MARHIDDSVPLSDDDRQWLTDWGRYAEIARIDALHGEGASDDEPDTEPTLFDEDDSEEAAAEEDSEDEAVLLPANWTVETEDGPYDDWTKDELADELQVRGRSKTGNKDDLIERLREADATGE